MTRQVVFISHGGGPLPVLGDPQHVELVEALNALRARLNKPKQIVVISAHWETQHVSITSSANPALLYDYYGFPQASYEFSYPCPGNPELAQTIAKLFRHNGHTPQLDGERGLDHGVFIPLMLLYPEADIPVIQVSLAESLDPSTHIEMGKILSGLGTDDTLFIGSGFSFHNMKGFFDKTDEIRSANENFENWLKNTLLSEKADYDSIEQKLINWRLAPGAEVCHPREEHLMPLHVCFGITQKQATDHTQMRVLSTKASNFVWSEC
jgi:4,5-DOPA dioxygenase extradiol